MSEGLFMLLILGVPFVAGCVVWSRGKRADPSVAKESKDDARDPQEIAGVQFVLVQSHGVLRRMRHRGNEQGEQ